MVQGVSFISLTLVFFGLVFFFVVAIKKKRYAFATLSMHWYNKTHKTFSQGLKYVKLSFSNNHLNSSGKAVPSHLNSKGGYIRQSDYFSGGMDSANTEAALIRPTSVPGPTGKWLK